MKASSLSNSNLPSRKGGGRFPTRNLSEPQVEKSTECEPSDQLPLPPRNRRTPRGTVVFKIEASAADRVKLAADFTAWDKEPLDLRRAGDGTWQIAVELPRGQYSYRFL